MVFGDARGDGHAWVDGNAMVFGDAWVSGNAMVSEDAWVSGNARVSEDAWVSDRSHLCWVDRLGTGESVAAYRNSEGGISVRAGCVEFRSLKEMKAYLKAGPTEYSELDSETRERYVKQGLAFVKLVKATIVL